MNSPQQTEIARSISALVLASGLSRRFGPTDKLLAPLRSKPLASHIAHTLLSLPLQKRIAVYSNPEVALLFTGYELLRNSEPERGMGKALQLGLQAIDTPYVLICLADMPLVSEQLLLRLCGYAAQGGAACSAGDYLGPPALVSRHALLSLPLDGDQGARPLLLSLPRLRANPDELRDFDQQADWARWSE